MALRPGILVQVLMLKTNENKYKNLAIWVELDLGRK